jgi:hypothetical protein
VVVLAAFGWRLVRLRNEADADRRTSTSNCSGAVTSSNLVEAVRATRRTSVVSSRK